MIEGFISAYPPDTAPSGPAIWLFLCDGELLVCREGEHVRFIIQEDDSRMSDCAASGIYLGLLEGTPVFADDYKKSDVLESCWEWIPLRNLYGVLSDAEYQLSGYASQLLFWRTHSKYCPVCGQATIAGNRDWGRHCPACGYVRYPQISPAVLILVHDGADRILLAHKPGWGSRYSILAGFVEPGESLEECVQREVQEETGISVGSLDYCGSQPWPYPSQLMVGFKAQYAEGTVQADGVEIDDARWFVRGALPDLPPPLSLSRQMIDQWALQGNS